MANSTAHVTVVDGAGAIQIVAAGLTKQMVTVRRLSNNTEIYLGTSGVTINNGLKLYDENVQLTLDIGNSLYAISLSGHGDDDLSVYVSSAMY